MVVYIHINDHTLSSQILRRLTVSLCCSKLTLTYSSYTEGTKTNNVDTLLIAQWLFILASGAKLSSFKYILNPYPVVILWSSITIVH